ncbi:acyl carrier protein [bacterium 1XD8-76]|nr:acyl carrier protein [bacterium 1XD8-76]
MKDREIQQFITDILMEINEEYEINEVTQLLEEEILDSVSILYLITELESAYEIQIPLEDIVEENFRNLECIEKYVVSLIGEKE